jgi:hypothetical protein
MVSVVATDNRVSKILKCYDSSALMDLMEAIEYVGAYIDDLLCIARGTVEDHLDKLREVLNMLHDAGLKVNAAKSFFCTHEIKYLDYMLTRAEMEPQQKRYR